MHSEQTQKEAPTQNEIGAADMLNDQPPQRDDFLLCLPTSIPGFNMNKKDWSKRGFPKLILGSNFPNKSALMLVGSPKYNGTLPLSILWLSTRKLKN